MTDSLTKPIAAKSRRQVMDWSLVLASQGIATAIAPPEQGWQLLVQESDHAQATALLNQYVTENRSWHWHRRLPGSRLVFHGGSSLWILLLTLFYYGQTLSLPNLQSGGLMDSQAVMRGQWWRLFTAVTLHGDAAHLLANATTGFLFLGLAMALYQPGPGLLAAFLAGALGNLLALWVYPVPHLGLGASGMVMGALGLLAVHSFSFWRRRLEIFSLLRRTLGAAVLMLVLLGFSPGTDVLAHVGGFLGGVLLGLALGLVSPTTRQRWSPVCLWLLLILVTTCWGLALAYGH